MRRNAVGAVAGGRYDADLHVVDGTQTAGIASCALNSMEQRSRADHADEDSAAQSDRGVACCPVWTLGGNKRMGIDPWEGMHA